MQTVYSKKHNGFYWNKDINGNEILQLCTCKPLVNENGKTELYYFAFIIILVK